MMEETVPSASNNTNTTGPTARRPRTNSLSQQQQQSSQQQQSPRHQHDEEDDQRSSRRLRRIHTNFSLLLSPTFLLSKIILLVTLILKILLFPLRKVSSVVFPPGEYDNVSNIRISQLSARAFVIMFQEYLKNAASSSSQQPPQLQCPFVQEGYGVTVKELAQQAQMHNEDPSSHVPPPLLLIYLHSPLHGMSSSFWDKITQRSGNGNGNSSRRNGGSDGNSQEDDSVLGLLNHYKNDGLVSCWGGSIHTADGLHVSESLQVCSYPFMALVRIYPTPSSSSSSSSNNNTNVQRKIEVLFRMEGPTLQKNPPSTLYKHLSTSILKYQSMLSEAAMRRYAREEETRLREEQDREYREALEEDQRRERVKREEMERRQEEERRHQEELQKVEMEKCRRLEDARRIMGDRMNGDELHGGGSGNVNVGDKVARIRLMLPSGKRIERKFWGADTIENVRAFLILYFEEHGIGIENFELRSNYPKKALVDGEKTLESEGLCPQAVIMVQDMDA